MEKSDRVSAEFLNLQSLLDLSLVLHEVETETALWNLVALALLGKLRLSAVAVGLREEFPQERFLAGSQKGKAAAVAFLHQGEKAPAFVYEHHRSASHPFFVLMVRRSRFGPLPPEAVVYLKMVLSLAAHAYRQLQRRRQLEELWRDKERKNQLLLSSLDITRTFARVWELSEIEHLLALVLRGQFRTTEFGFWVWDEKNHLLLQQVHLPQQVTVQWREGEWEIPPRWRAIGNRWGKGGKMVIVVESQPKTLEEQEAHHWFLETVCSVVGTALERYRLIQEEIARQRLEEELNFAARIQQQLFPKAIHLPPAYEFFAHNTPSRFVGGDYYDVIQQSAGRWLFAIADVSGKGVPASLLMANFQAALQILARECETPVQIVERLNAHLVAHTNPEQFVTCFLMVLDAKTGRVESVNAGHFPPLIITTSGCIRRLEAGGLPLGLFPEVSYEQEAWDFQIGDLLCAYTDGIVEAQNAVGEQYEERRLVEVLQRSQGAVAAIGKAVLEDVLRFAHGKLQDDLTFFLLKRLCGDAG